MQSETLSARNAGCLIALMASSSLLMAGAGTAGQDSWIAILAATILAVPLAILYARISGLNRGLDIFEISYRQLGKIGGAVVTLLLCWYALHISALVTRNFSEFVVSISLGSTPKIFIDIGMIAVGAYLASTSFKVMGRWSLIVMVVVAANLLGTFLLSLSSMNFSHLKPVLEHGAGEILSMAFSFGAIAFGETVLVLAAMGSLNGTEKPYKAYLLGIGCGGLLLVCVVMRNILVLGRSVASTTVFPSYVATRIVNPGSFIEHIESIVSFNLILMGVTKVSLCLRAAAMGISRLLNAGDLGKRFLAPLSLLSLAICLTSFANMQELMDFMAAYRYYAVPFAVVIPVVLWGLSEKRERSQGGGRPEDSRGPTPQP